MQYGDDAGTVLPQRRSMKRRQAALELLLKGCYVVSVLCVAASLAVVASRQVSSDTSLDQLRLAGSIAGTLSLIGLLFSWHGRIGWLSPPISWTVVAGLILLVFGDIASLQVRDDDMAYMGLMFYACADLALALALWLPSVPLSSLGAEGVTGTWTAPPHSAVRVPFGALPFVILVAPLAMCIFFIVELGQAGSLNKTTTANQAWTVFSLACAQLVVLWRAAARIGYRSPTTKLALQQLIDLDAAGEDNPGAPLLAAAPAGPHRSSNAAGSSASGRSTGLSVPADPGPKLARRGRQASGVVQRLQAAMATAGSTAAVRGRARDGRIGDTSVFAIYGRSETLEGRGWQWLALVGVLLLVGGQLVALAVSFYKWHDASLLPVDGHNGNRAILVLYALANGAGQLCIVLATPLVRAPRGTLDDPYVCPRPAESATVRVICPLPDRGADAAFVATMWFLLTKRGHQVHFATRTGRPAQLDEGGVVGLGPAGLLGAGPLVGAMMWLLRKDDYFQRPFLLQSVRPDSYDGMLVVDGRRGELLGAWLDSAELKQLLTGFWDIGRPLAASGCGVAVLASCPRDGDGRPMVDGCVVTSLSSSQERMLGLANVFCGCDCRREQGGAGRGQLLEGIVRGAVGATGRYLGGPLTGLSRGSPWDDSDAFVAEDGRLVTGRWSGDAFLLARRFWTKLEDVHRLYG